jgi:hypothetical protein
VHNRQEYFLLLRFIKTNKKAALIAAFLLLLFQLRLNLFNDTYKTNSIEAEDLSQTQRKVHVLQTNFRKPGQIKIVTTLIFKSRQCCVFTKFAPAPDSQNLSSPYAQPPATKNTSDTLTQKISPLMEIFLCGGERGLDSNPSVRQIRQERIYSLPPCSSPRLASRGHHKKHDVQN